MKGVMHMQPLLVITGPTAVGKTELTLALARRLDGEVVSADSMQVYRGMDIGTAKPTAAERQGIPHHLIDIADPNESYDVARFVSDASAAIAEIAGRGRLPIVSGGTGLYISSLLSGAVFPEGTRDEDYRRTLDIYEKDFGADGLHAMLAAADPESAAAIHPNNLPRVKRALEFFHCTGEKFSAYRAGQQNAPSPYRATILLLERPRQELYARIEQRVDQMLGQGLLGEVESLLAAGVSARANAMQGLGYKELVYYIRGLSTWEESVRLLKRNTRRYAKRQLTWWRHRKHIHPVPAGVSIEQAVQVFSTDQGGIGT